MLGTGVRMGVRVGVRMGAGIGAGIIKNLCLQYRVSDTITWRL